MESNVNCINSRAVIGYVRRNYPELMESLLEDLDPFFYAVDNIEEYLCDEHNWISQRVCAKMFARVREYSGDPEAARKIGHESLNLHSYGYIENILVKTFGHPYFAIKRAPKSLKANVGP